MLSSEVLGGEAQAVARRRSAGRDSLRSEFKREV